jgi:hypothetical protein
MNLSSFFTNADAFAMWWHSVLRQPELITKVERITIVQRLFISHHITKPMSAFLTIHILLKDAHGLQDFS